MTYKKFVKTKRYAFQLEINFNASSIFTIYAKHLDSNRVSNITDLNWIISELGKIIVDEDHLYETDWDADWVIENNNLARTLWKKATSMFSSTSFLSYLEKKLDEDRSYGEWENGYQF